MKEEKLKKKLYISLSFDDGRVDNYENAFKILQKYNLKATIHVISGYIDGTYKEHISSSKGPCTIEQLLEMKENGFEISLHGDQHITNVSDYNICIHKLKKWNLINDDYGYSVPNSKEDNINNHFMENLLSTNTKYIRTGKNNKKLNFKYKLFYVLATYLNSPFFFKLYNEINVNNFDTLDWMYLNSVVVRRNTTFNMIKKLINKNLEKNDWIIFMFHSILKENDKLFFESDWAWSIENFDKLCNYLCFLEKNNEIIVDTIINIVSERKR